MPSSRPTSAAWLAPLVFIALYIALDRLWGVPIWVAVAYLVLSAISFGQYAADKRAAQQNRWRIPESTLQLVSLLGGWPGSIAAQQVLRHKTRKTSFLVTFWGMVVLNVVVFVGAVAVLRGNVLETFGL